MESIIRLACIAHQTDYWCRGRTLKRLGIDHLSVSEMTRYVTGKTSHQMPVQSRRLSLAPISVSRVEQTRKTNRGGLHDQSLMHKEIITLSGTVTTGN